MPRLRGVVALAVAGLLTGLGPSAGHAQAPGYQQLNPNSIRAEYMAEVLDRINELLADWGSAWANDRVDELVALYAEDAVLVPPDGDPVRGHTAIRDYFTAALPRHGSIEAFMLDFDASGEMSQVFGNYMLEMRAGDGAGGERRGPMLTVYMRRNRTWLIRSQIFPRG